MQIEYFRGLMYRILNKNDTKNKIKTSMRIMD